MVFPTDAVFESQAAGGLEAVLREETVVLGDAVVVLFDGSVGRVIRQAEQEIGDVGTGIAAVEIEVAVVVAAGKAERRLRAKPAYVAAELKGVAALVPGEVVGPLVGVGEGETRFAKTDAGRSAD